MGLIQENVVQERKTCRKILKIGSIHKHGNMLQNFEEVIEQMNKVINFINLTYNSTCIPGKGANKIFGMNSPETSKAA